MKPDTQTINTAARFYVLAALLICGCLITGVIISSSCLLVYPDAGSHILRISFIIGIIDFLVSCPAYYFFDAGETPSPDIKSYISNLPYSLIRNVPDRISARMAGRWVLQTLLYGIVGIMGGVLGIYASRMGSPELTEADLPAPFWSGSFMVYCSGCISLIFDRKNDKPEEQADNTIPENKDKVGIKTAVEKHKYIWSFVFLWALLIAVCLMLLSRKEISFIENTLGFVALCLGFVLSAVVLNIISENFKLKQDISGKTQLVANLEREAWHKTEENENLINQKNTLFKEKREMINIMCGEYVDKWDSDKMRPFILKRIETEVGKLQSASFRKSIQKEIEEYYGDLFSEIRDRDLFKPDDIYFLQLVIAGFSQKAVSLINNIHPKNFYTKKYRLIEKIKHSDLSNRNELLDILSKKQSEPA